jgi:hypothetical protein
VQEVVYCHGCESGDDQDQSFAYDGDVLVLARMSDHAQECLEAGS